MFVNIFISSKNLVSLNASLVFILKSLGDIRTKTSFSASQHSKPTTIKKVTVLKSPHVNKKAQEQFESRMYKTQVSLYTAQTLKFLKILKKIQFKLFADVNIKIRVVISDRKFNLESKKKLNPNEFFSKKKKSKKLKTNSYLKLLDMYGENILSIRKRKLFWLPVPPSSKSSFEVLPPSSL